MVNKKNNENLSLRNKSIKYYICIYNKKTKKILSNVILFKPNRKHNIFLYINYKVRKL